uniref:Uncharacterized protein n=1 Tax=Trichuris muris TaxID=70415 RepID=A0A5S6R2C9_TRIMR
MQYAEKFYSYKSAWPNGPTLLQLVTPPRKPRRADILRRRVVQNKPSRANAPRTLVWAGSTLPPLPNRLRERGERRQLYDELFGSLSPLTSAKRVRPYLVEPTYPVALKACYGPLRSCTNRARWRCDGTESSNWRRPTTIPCKCASPTAREGGTTCKRYKMLKHNSALQIKPSTRAHKSNWPCKLKA